MFFLKEKVGILGYCIICAIALFFANIWLGVVVTAVGTLFGAIILYAVLM